VKVSGVLKVAVLLLVVAVVSFVAGYFVMMRYVS
jgi:uncharacterized protein YneF (UPF0154 family)